MNKLLLAAQLSVKSHKYYAVFGLSATEMEKNRRRGLKI
jgi:hypothetical protein